MNILPLPRQVPEVPRPQHGELSGSYLERIAKANRISFREFLGLLGTVPAGVSSEGPDLAVMVLTLNDAAFTRLLAYTGLDGDKLVKAIPSLTPHSRGQDEPSAIRLSFLRSLAADCPGCRLRRRGAYADTRVFEHKTACLHHGYWLYGRGRGQRLNLASLPEVTAAQRRLQRIASRRGPTAAMRVFELASWYLEHAWRINYHPHWYPVLLERWQQRVRKMGATVVTTTWQMPTWATHPECVALAATFASPYWATQAVPAADQRHRLFYEHLATELGVFDKTALRTVRIFDPLPRDIQEQARWGRLLSDSDWDAPPPPGAVPRRVLFHDIAGAHEMRESGGLPSAG
jgi:hypothetical protein